MPLVTTGAVLVLGIIAIPLYPGLDATASDQVLALVLRDVMTTSTFGYWTVVTLLAAIVAAALWLRSDGDEEREPPAAPSATGPSRPCDHAEDSRIDLGGAEATGCRAYLTGRRLCLRCEAREWGNLEEVHLPERPAGSHLDIKAEAALVELPLTPGAELRLELRWKDVARWAVLRLPGGSARPDHIGVVEPVLVPIFYSLNRGEGYPDCGITEPQLLIDGCERREGLAWLAAELDRLRAAGAARLATLPAGLSLRAETDPEGHPFIAVRSPGDPRVTHQLVFPPQMLEIVPTTGGEPVVLRLDVEKQWWLERKGEDGRMRFDRLR